MSDSLKNYAKNSFHFDDEKFMVEDKDGQPFELNQHVLEWEGNTVFERCHPTFISKKRKVILTCPRKVGHSSIRFYLNYMNEVENDDWIWIEDNDRYPKNWLNKEDLLKLYTDLFSDKNKINIIRNKESCNMDVYTNQNQYNYSSQLLWNQDRESIEELFGKENSITWPQDFSESEDHQTNHILSREQSFSPPFQTLNPFTEYTSYLIVRDPWDRFISGLITEMDNGLLNPWKYDIVADSKIGWERIYNSAKRILFFTEPEYLMIGGLDGPQANHTFLLARPLWRGKSMYDIYDNLIHYKHDIEYKGDGGFGLSLDQESLKKSTGVIENLKNLGFISQDAITNFHEKEHYNMHAHTHVNVTPHIRQHVINELQQDEDLKEWWDRCRELVDIEYDCLKNNEHKFKNA